MVHIMYTLRWLAAFSACLANKKQWHTMYKAAYIWPQRVTCTIKKRKINNACLKTA